MGAIARSSVGVRGERFLVNGLAQSTSPARPPIARRRCIAALTVLLGLAGLAAPAAAELFDTAWARPMLSSSVASFVPSRAAVTQVSVRPAAVTIPCIDAGCAPAPAVETIAPVDVQRLLRTRLELDPRLGPDAARRRLVSWTLPLVDDRGPWREFEAAAGESPSMLLFNVPFGAGTLSFGLGTQTLEGSRGLLQGTFALVPDMASLLMSQGARVGDDGFVIPTFEWRAGSNFAMGVDVPVATHDRADAWGVVGRLSITF